MEAKIKNKVPFQITVYFSLCIPSSLQTFFLFYEMEQCFFCLVFFLLLSSEFSPLSVFYISFYFLTETSIIHH